MTGQRSEKASAARKTLPERILAGIEMVNEAEANELLALDALDFSRVLQHMEQMGEVLGFLVNEVWQYPRFQFDADRKQILPGLAKIIQLSDQRGFSRYRLLNWLFLLHLDFAKPPVEALAEQPQLVIEAFKREIEEEVHG